MPENEVLIVESLLIPIDAERMTVNARDLWEFLGVKSIFTHWIRYKIKQYGFEEGPDYLLILANNPGRGRPVHEYHLSWDMAKELGMIENNSQGKGARLYFIAVERKFRFFNYSQK